MPKVERVPASIGGVNVLGCSAIGLASLVTILEGLSTGAGDFPFAVLLFVVPAITAACLVHHASKGNWSLLFKVGGAGAGIQGLLGLVATFLIGGPNARYALFVLILAALTVCFAAVLALPLVIAAGVIGRRRDLEAGDLMLAVSGLWVAAVQMLKLAAFPDDLKTFAAGLVAALIACGIYVARRTARRAWCARAARGELTGFRVRTLTTDEELDLLPPVFGPPQTAFAVIERVEMGGAMYRGAEITQPVATMTYELTRP
jgi:hypothetical protein